MKVCGNYHNGFGYLAVLLVVLIIGAVALTVSLALSTQSNAASLAQYSTAALNAAENGIAVGYAALRAGGTFTGFTIQDGNFTVEVTYSSTTSNLQAKATWGRYSRTVNLIVTTSSASGLLNAYGLACGGTLTFQNGAYDFKGVPVYGHNINLYSNGVPGNSGAATTLSTDASKINLFDDKGKTLTDYWKVKDINDRLASAHITTQTNAASFTVPDVNWNSFTSEFPVISIPSGTTDYRLSKYFRNSFQSNPSLSFNGKTIIITVSGGTPNITLDGSELWGGDTDKMNCTIVIKKVGTAATDPTVIPTLTIQNGSWGSSTLPMHLSAYIDGNFVLKNGLYTDGNFYVSGTSSVTNGAYNFRGGFMSKGDITGVNGFEMSSMNVDWDPSHFLLPVTVSKSTWSEQ